MSITPATGRIPTPPGDDGPAPVPALARGPVLTVVAVVAVAQLAAASVRGRWFDELLMLAIGRHHLDWGSADQPPVAPLLAASADRIAPGSSFALAVPTVVATAGAVLIAALIARELGGDARAQTLTALAQATGTWAALAGHWLTPYSLEAVQWLAVVWLLVRWQRVRDDRLLLVLGVVLGVAAQTKFQVLLLGVVVLVAVAVVGPRALLARPRLWVGVGIAAVIAAPTLVWQALHGWPQLAMGPIVAGEADALYGGRAGVTVLLVAFAGVLGAVLALYGLGRTFLDAHARTLRWLGVTTVVLFVVFAVSPGRPYYLAGLYGALAAVGALGLQRRREEGRRRWSWLAWPASAVSAVVALGALAVSVLMASPIVPDAIAAQTAAAYRELPAPQRERTALLGESYVYAVYLDTADPELGLPPAYSGNRSYGYFALPPETADTVLYVGTDPGRLRPYFADVRLVSTTDTGGAVGLDGRPVEAPIWLLAGRNAPWTEVRGAVTDLAVS